jgi:hypothetical protein
MLVSGREYVQEGVPFIAGRVILTEGNPVSPAMDDFNGGSNSRLARRLLRRLSLVRFSHRRDGTVRRSGKSALSGGQPRPFARGISWFERSLPMHKLMVVVATLLFVAVFAVVPAATAGEASRSGG